MFNKRINIFTGHFGSGKTEVAVNFAKQLTNFYKKVAIADLDIVNPYFRTTDAKQELERSGVRVVVPMYANTNVDVPALPAEVNTLLEQKDYRVVMDIGGDDLGARVLARYREDILADDYEVFFVINARRPMTDTLDKIIEMVQSVEESSRMKVTKLVNNTNLLNFTSPEDLLHGQELVRQASQRLKIPQGFTAVMKTGDEPISGIQGEILYLDKLIHLPWDQT